MATSTWYEVIGTPLGDVFVGGFRRWLHRIDFLREGKRGALDEAHWARTLSAETGEPPSRDAIGAASAREARTQLAEFMAGARTTFDLPLAPLGTAWQRSVWDALLTIPFGETASYGEIARRVGRPAASRAVGAAVGRNPIAMVIPCHRVVGADGSLTGYAGGLERKRWLLDLEARPPSSGAASIAAA